MIRILSVNLGKLKAIAAKYGVSGIFKSPQLGPITVNSEGLANDAIEDLNNHGGVDQAVYVYTQEDYDWWQQQEGLEAYPGLFGENLTIAGMTTANAHIGARLISDTLTLEVTSPRTPCETLAARMNDAKFPKRFWKSHRTGFYCRVISSGTVASGQEMQLKAHDGPHVTIEEWIKNEPFEKMNAETRQRFLSVPIHYKARTRLQS